MLISCGEEVRVFRWRGGGVEGWKWEWGIDLDGRGVGIDHRDGE